MRRPDGEGVQLKGLSLAAPLCLTLPERDNPSARQRFEAAHD